MHSLRFLFLYQPYDPLCMLDGEKEVKDYDFAFFYCSTATMCPGEKNGSITGLKKEKK